MKTLKKINLILSLATVLGCQTPQPVETEFSIMPDITGSNGHTTIDISTEDIVEVFDLENSPFNYGKLRISTLSETHLSEIHQAKLSPVTSMNSYNKYSRESEVKRFIESVDSLLVLVSNIQKGKQASSLFIPISRELHRLARSQAQQKILVIYSDLFENSSALFSAYSQTQFSQLLKDPERLTKILNQNAPLPQELLGIKVYIIYSPVLDTADDFLAISNWYKQELESRNAEVYVGANLVLD